MEMCRGTLQPKKPQEVPWKQGASRSGPQRCLRGVLEEPETLENPPEEP